MTVHPRSTIARRFLATTLVSLGGVMLTIAMLQAPQGISVAAGPAAERFTIVPGESTASYHVQETFLRNMQFNVAVGTTRDVRGEIVFDRANPRNTRIGTITIDVSKLQSDNGTRDNFIRRNTLETEKFPTAEFTPTEILGLPEIVAAGREVAASIRGNLRIKDATRPATFAATLRFDGTAITGAASTTIRLMDYNVSPPNIANIVRAEDSARLEFRFVARPQR